MTHDHDHDHDPLDNHMTSIPCCKSVVIDAVGDAAYAHACGTYVSPAFMGSANIVYCPTCGEVI